MLADYGIEDRIPEVKDWYNGYIFREKEIYNPWSVINYVDSIVNDHKQFPEPYWANTSSNRIIKDMVWQADEDMKKELDELIRGGTIEKKIHEDIHESEDNLWNFLFFTGYMKKVSYRQIRDKKYEEGILDDGYTLKLCAYERTFRYRRSDGDFRGIRPVRL